MAIRAKVQAECIDAPCPACGRLVLRGATRTGEVLVLDQQIPMYVVCWDAEAAYPRFARSMGYPVHQCSDVQQTGIGKSGDSGEPTTIF